MKINKKTLLLFLVSSALFFSAQQKTVSTQINFKQPYCGGARPSAEMLAEAEMAKPYAGKTIIIVSSKGKVDSSKTNSKGLFSANLNIGTYKVYEAWRYYKKGAGGMAVSDFNKKCLKKEWKKEILQIIVTEKDTKIVDKNEIIIVCPWNLPCILETKKSPMPE